MTKSELIKIISAQYIHYPIDIINNVINKIFDYMSVTLSRGEKIELRRFGSFSIRKRKINKTFTGKTDEFRNIIYFRAGKKFKKVINEER